jgi:hypothetical protein
MVLHTMAEETKPVTPVIEAVTEFAAKTQAALLKKMGYDPKEMGAVKAERDGLKQANTALREEIGQLKAKAEQDIHDAETENLDLDEKLNAALDQVKAEEKNLDGLTADNKKMRALLGLNESDPIPNKLPGQEYGQNNENTGYLAKAKSWWNKE